MMSQLAMAVASASSHSSQHSSSGDDHNMSSMSGMSVVSGSDDVKGVSANVKNCSCCDEPGDQTCPDSACECDVCVSALAMPLAVSLKPAPHASVNSFNFNDLLERVPTVIVPPPISSAI